MATICDICSRSNSTILWRVDGYDIWHCPRCDLIYADVDERDVEGLYEESYYKTVYPDYESDRDMHVASSNIVLDTVERYFSPGTMIEIGSAFGFFLECAARRGWRAVGYETSRYASSIARATYGLDVRNEDFLGSDVGGKIDVACLLDTIEHLIRPSLYIEKISRVLAPRGGLILTTGDISSLMGRLLGKRWRMVSPPLHVYYYSRRSISNLLHAYGFDVLSITHPGKYQYLNSIASFALGIRKGLLPRIPVKVNFKDIMLVIARKT